MKLPPIRNQEKPPSNQKFPVLPVLLGTIGILAIIGLVILLGQGMPQLAVPGATATPLVPTMSIPTPDCGSPTLTLGTATFQVQNLTPAPDGSLPVPPDTSGIAYWVEGTNTNHVFVLSPTPENLSMASGLTAGTTAKATWKNCNSTSYSLSAPESDVMNVSDLPDQSLDGIIVFIPSDSSGNGILVKGELTEEQISTVDTPAPGELEIQANIGLLETTTSSNGTTIRIGVSINNYGESPFTLSDSEVSLFQEDSAALAMISSEPPLPKEIAAGTTETLYFTFPRPASPTATLKILTIEYDIEGY